MVEIYKLLKHHKYFSVDLAKRMNKWKIKCVTTREAKIMLVLVHLHLMTANYFYVHLHFSNIHVMFHLIWNLSIPEIYISDNVIKFSSDDESVSSWSKIRYLIFILLHIILQPMG